VRPIDKKQWKAEIALLAKVFNAGFTEEWEYSPATVGEFLEGFGPLKPIVDPDTLLFAEIDGRTAGFAIGFPDLGPLLGSFRGTLGPLKILRLMREGKRPARRGLILVVVDPAHRGRGVAQALCATLFRRYEALGLRSAPYYPVNHANAGSRRLAESFGGVGRVTHTIYDRVLSQ
jgi:GNAT superfamily N-acetyltransferase